MTDVGKSLFCRVTATNAAGSASADSNTVGPVTAAATGTTWDPANKTANMDLSGGNLTATVDGVPNTFEYNQVRATASKSTGKRYLEYNVITTADLSAYEARATVGLADSTHAIGATIPGFDDSTGFSLRLHDASIYGNSLTGVNSLYPDPIVPVAGNIVVGCAVDLDAQTVTGVYKNGILIPMNSSYNYPLYWGGTALAAVFPIITLQWQAVAPISVTLNTVGSFSLATLPSGYVAWDT